jgi:hypothetical protein
MSAANCIIGKFQFSIGIPLESRNFAVVTNTDAK